MSRKDNNDGKRRQRSKRYPGVYWRLNRHGTRVYEYTYTDEDGRTRWKTCNGLDERKTFEARAAQIATIRTRRQRCTPNETFAQSLSEHFARINVSRRTMADYRRHAAGYLEKPLGDRPTQTITTDDVEQLISGIERQGRAPDTVRAIWNVLHATLETARRRDVISRNPCERVRKKPKSQRRTRRLKFDEIARLVQAAEPGVATVALHLLVFAGLRLSELLALRWADIEFDDAYIDLSYQKPRRDGYGENDEVPELAELKNNEPREVDLDPLTLKLLERWRAITAYGADDDYVLATASGAAFEQRSFYTHVFYPARAAAGLEEAGPKRCVVHTLRHTYASLVARFETIAYLSDQLGHNSVAVTARYVHFWKQAERRRQKFASMEEIVRHILGPEPPQLTA